MTAVRDALLKRPTRQVEVEKPRLALELWLEKQLDLSVMACTAAAANDSDVLAMWMVGLLDEKEAGLLKHVSGGGVWRRRRWRRSGRHEHQGVTFPGIIPVLGPF